MSQCRQVIPSWHACSTGEADNILTVFDEYRYGYWCEHKRRVAMRVGTESGMRKVNPKERYPANVSFSIRSLHSVPSLIFRDAMSNFTR